VIVTHNNPFFLKFVYDEFYHDGENKSNEKEVNQMLNMEERKEKEINNMVDILKQIDLPDILLLSRDANTLLMRQQEAGMVKESA
jgi:hypothetical protein